MDQKNRQIPSPVGLAALVYGCNTDDLLSYHEFPDGSVTIIAPTGQKFTYSAQRLREMLQELSEDPPPAETAEESSTDPDGQQVFNEVLNRLIRQLGLDNDQPAGEGQPASEFSQAPQPATVASPSEQNPEEQKESTCSSAPTPQPDPPEEVPDAQPPSPFPQQGAEIETSAEESGGANAAKKRKTRSSIRRKSAAQHSGGSHQDN